MLGEIRGTPTIRLFLPVTKQQDQSNKKKRVLDYNYERKAVDMKRFLDQNMPSFVERVTAESIDKFAAKAARHGLPQVLLFTSKAKTSPLTKYLSTEFRRRLLLGQVYPTKPNQQLLQQYGIAADQLPALLVIPPAADDNNDDDDDNEEIVVEPIRYQGSDYTRGKLFYFLSQHALKEPVFPAKKKKQEKEEPTKKEEKIKATADGSGGQHTEL